MASEDARHILAAHLKLGIHKTVSYLPIVTVTDVLKLTVDEYIRLIERAGHQAAVFSTERSCIKSGAIYAFSRSDLETVLQDSAPVLTRYGWPVDADSFIERIAWEWLDEDSPILPIVRRAFGDARSGERP